MSAPLFRKVAIIGLGLIGSSFARALRERRLAGEITGSARSARTCALAQEIGVVDRAFADPAEAVRDADLVFLAMPVQSTEAVLRAIKDALRPDAIVTDGGSTKGNVVAAARAVFGTLPAGFVPGHPIAGSEQSGVLAGRANLYERHKVILTPLPESDPVAVARVRAVWEAMGAEVLEMSVARHDEVLARTDRKSVV